MPATAEPPIAPPDQKPVEFSLDDWAEDAPDAFRAALAEVFADESEDLFFNRYERGPMAGFTNVERIVTRMEQKLARMEHSIMPPAWITARRERRTEADEE